MAGAGDFNGDGRSDILWRHMGNGRNTIWLMGGMTLLPGTGPLTPMADPSWSIVATSE